MTREREVALGLLQELAQRRALRLAVHRVAVREVLEVDRVGVELRAVHAGELAPAAELTRQPPHMPVPSTMTELRLTTVWMPCGRVTSATARIIGTGPIAST